MNIFVIEGNVVKPTPEALLIPEFAILWDRDKSKNKSRAISEFTYIEFLCSVKKSNPFHGYSDEERPAKIKAFIFKNKETIDTSCSDVIAATIVYRQLMIDSSTSMQYYLSVKTGIHKMIKFYQELDLTEKNDKGVLVYKVSDVTAAITKANEMLQNLSSLRERVEQEMYESTRTKSNKEINPFEK